MEANMDTRLLIVDNDRLQCDSLQQMISGWGINTKIITKPTLVANQVKDTYFNIVLLDVVMPEKSGFDLIPEINRLCPETKIIIMTGYANKEKAIKALRLGVFDFLEKPIKMELLHHCVVRALDNQKIKLQLSRTLEELKRKQSDLLAHKKRLEHVNEELLENNNALSVLARNLERTRHESEMRIVLKIRSLIMPIVEKLQQDEKLKRYKAELSMLEDHIETLTSGLGTDARIAPVLSASELRIASMVMNGLTSQEIAKQLYISLNTVKTHRRNIRKKLNINRAHYNLRTYLESRIRKEQGILNALQYSIQGPSPIC
jgi:DNA-binding NarL/FixJ family response regulator